MGRFEEHRAALQALPVADWDAYLTANSGLPGPRANLELARAVAEEAPPATLRRYAAAGDEYLALCGAAGLGRLLAEGDPTVADELERLAGDDRWRVREGVAMGLQRLGDADLPRLLALAARWAASPSALVQRAAVAGVCEPRLLRQPGPAGRALDLLDTVTGSLVARPAAERAGPPVRVLRQALGYCWSVAVAALPGAGFGRLERWAASDDPDMRWLVRENLGKSRLVRADPDALARLRNRAGLDRSRPIDR
jgi:hypothetical protein